MINILSLFDGISCGQIALERAGIKVNNYFASEIDEKAIKVTQTNYPKTIQLGSILNWESWKLPEIYLVIGGSPCTGFSMIGKGLNFDDPQSKLYFEFLEVLNAVKPKYFLLENVKMKNQFRDIISNDLGVEPIEINSTLVSKQSRRRIYWTNIPNVVQPEDKNLCFNRIVYIVPHGYIKESVYYASKHPPLTADGPPSSKYKIVNNDELLQQCLSKSNEQNPKGLILDYIWNENDILINNISINKSNFHTLTPEECEELQTLPPNYTACINKTSRYKAIGNGWTVDVIAHIFSFLPKEFQEF